MVPVERSAVEVPLGSTTTISAIVHLACIISVMRYLPGDSSPLFHASPSAKLKLSSEAEVTNVKCSVVSVGQMVLTTEIEPSWGGPGHFDKLSIHDCWAEDL